MIPIKISDSSGFPITVCIHSEAGALEAIETLDPLTEMLPYYSSVRLDPKNIHSRNGDRHVIVRPQRRHSRSPQLDLLSMLAELSFELNKVYKRTKQKYPNHGFVSILEENSFEECFFGESKLEMISPLKINIDKCVESLYKLNKSIWITALQTGDYEYNSNLDFFDLNVGKITGLSISSVLMKLRTALQLGMYIRSHNYVYHDDGTRVKRFSLPELVLKLDEIDEPGKSELFKLLYGSYSGLAHYPMLVWFAGVFGIELYSNTKKAYRISSLDIPEALTGIAKKLVPVVQAKAIPYGDHRNDTLERYTRRLDLDSISMSAAIDMYNHMIVSNTPYRAILHDLFIKSFGEALISMDQDPDTLLVLPVYYPKHYIHKKVDMVPVPLTQTVAIRGQSIFNDISTLETLESYGEDISKQGFAAISVMKNLEAIRREVEIRYTDKVKRILDELNPDETCIKGVIVEVYNPLIGFFLYPEVLSRVAFQHPSPSLSVNLFKFLLERITGSNEFTINFYVITNGSQLLSDYIEGKRVDTEDEAMGRLRRSLFETSNGELAVAYGVNLERIGKIIIDKRAIDSLEKGRRKCFLQLRSLSKELFRGIRI